MSPVSEGLLDAILINIVIPEVASILRREPGLTDDQIIARVYERKSRIIARGRAFLAETDDGPVDG